MKTMRDVAIVDTGFIIALIDTDDAHHLKAWTLLQDERWDFRLSPAVLVEVFHRKIQKKVAGDSVSSERRRAGTRVW